jgi:hypothetical protein
MKLKYPTINVIATAVAAYEFNGNKIFRDTISEGKPVVPNRQLISDYVQGNSSPFVVNDIHVKQAEGIIQYLQQTVIMQSLINKVDRFLGQTTELLSNQTVLNKDIGILAWAPHLADQYQKKDRVREISARFEHHSRYVGHVRDKITVDFTLIEKRYIKSMDCWAVYGSDANDNLIFYWARSLDKICEVGQISGRIKDHREDPYHNDAKVTTLNYVKVL